MKLSEFLNYDEIYIQCHDNPDADAIASGFGLYEYFNSNGKRVHLIYSGRNKIQKSNLVLMVGKLSIPIEYFDVNVDKISNDALLITVDCQYGAGNVTHIDASNIAIIDHHQIEIDSIENSLIMAGIGSCSTIVWKLLKEEGLSLKGNDKLGTALYYGLYTDTNQLSEIRNPLDMDMRDEITYDASLIAMFKNSNLSLQELGIAGNAMTQYKFNEEHRFGMVETKPCDPNILGLISDFLLQVDVVQACLVYNENPDGYKISVRSCVKEVNASELAAYLTENIGSGGGHYDKAGGFISKGLLKKNVVDKRLANDIEEYLHDRMIQYFESFELIYAKQHKVDVDSMKLFKKKQVPVGFVKMADVLPLKTPITIRTIEGDIDLEVEDDIFIAIGIKGEVYPNKEEKFRKSYMEVDEPYIFEECVISPDYVPTIKNRKDGTSIPITDYAKKCYSRGDTPVYARELENGVKVFTEWDKNRYMLGKKGDYLVARSDDLNDIYVVERDIFHKTYDRVEE